VAEAAEPFTWMSKRRKQLAGTLSDGEQQMLAIAILLVEQHVTMALSVTERAYILERGRVRYDGPSQDLADRDDLLRSVFLESAPADRRERALQRLSG
jgi:ABC-type branched-subunit amino acid transport system ATPase component